MAFPSSGFTLDLNTVLMTPELQTTLKRWLESEEPPLSFYDLLGLPLLSAETERLAGMVDQAVEFFFGYSNNHKDKRVRERATQLGKQLAEARRLLRNPEQLRSYDRDLVAGRWESAWDEFLDQFDESRHEDVRAYCHGEKSAETVTSGETIRDIWKTLKSPEAVVCPFDAETARRAQEAWATYLDQPVVWENSVGMNMVVIPPGQFRMGSPASEKGHFENERQVEVELTKPFSLGQFAVTQKDWLAVMSSEPWKDQDFVNPRADAPAVYLGWDEADLFCRLLTKRDHLAGRLPEDWRYALPTEAQWEFACRSGSVTRYYFGEDADEKNIEEHAWFEVNAWDAGDGHAMPVGQKLPNAFGLYDMAGNVWEWCRDWYLPALPGGTDPEAVGESGLRSTRGGSWGHPAGMCRSAYRLGKEPETKNSNQGFRVAAVPAK